eukprot:NODE_902_length_1386_cov_85.866866_g751_i0.p1 GENE.NODE_902_length_1386_cov_85.866866_g751_i0~~NODE_902_length_1386_cov_85.866866_g751_i0.p1  ORF type:complete len:433 (+),score=120.80 NODE_902_length_1386_cov_85.866866_g751_i0:2-1300(+)
MSAEYMGGRGGRFTCDPICMLRADEEIAATTRKSQTDKPIWNESFSFGVSSTGSLHVSVRDQNKEGVLLGEGSLVLDHAFESRLMQHRNRLEDWVQLRRSGTRGGRVRLLMEGEFASKKVYESRKAPPIQYSERYVTSNGTTTRVPSPKKEEVVVVSGNTIEVHSAVDVQHCQTSPQAGTSQGEEAIIVVDGNTIEVVAAEQYRSTGTLISPRPQIATASPLYASRDYYHTMPDPPQPSATQPSPTTSASASPRRAGARRKTDLQLTYSSSTIDRDASRENLQQTYSASTMERDQSWFQTESQSSLTSVPLEKYLASTTSAAARDYLIHRHGVGLPDQAPESDPPTLGMDVRLQDDGKHVKIVVHSVRPGGPAAVAGLFPEDLLHSWSGTPITSEVQLMTMLGEANPGESITLGIVRNGTKYNVPMVVGKSE